MKPDDIPQDVWDAATILIRGQSSGHSAEHKTKFGLTRIAAAAILSERERCAKVAERKWRGAPMYPDGADIAVDIRTGEQP